MTTLKHREFYEEARVFLKNCGRPKDEYDKFLISEAKWTCSYFKAMIDALKKELEE